ALPEPGDPSATLMRRASSAAPSATVLRKGRGSRAEVGSAGRHGWRPATVMRWGGTGAGRWRTGGVPFLWLGTPMTDKLLGRARLVAQGLLTRPHADPLAVVTAQGA